MSEPRITNLVSKMRDVELSRRDVLKKSGMAAVSASALSMLLTGRAFAAPGSSTPRYLVDQIDAKTLVVTDSLSGSYWLGLDPAWYYEINPTMAMFAIYDQLYAGQDGSDPTNIQPLLADGMPT